MADHKFPDGASFVFQGQCLEVRDSVDDRTKLGVRWCTIGWLGGQKSVRLEPSVVVTKGDNVRAFVAGRLFKGDFQPGEVLRFEVVR